MNQKDFVSYEQAVELKAAGFNWPCVAFYERSYGKMWVATDGKERWNSGTDYSAPTLWQAQKWLREVKGVIITVTPKTDTADFNDIPKDFLTGKWCYDIWFGESVHRNYMVSYPSYEQTLSAGIDAALKLIDKKGEYV